MKKVCVIGSLNIDIVSNVDKFVLPGETIKGTSLKRYYGGKGANQCVAAGRLGSNVSIFGLVGDDGIGHKYIEYLSKENIKTDNLLVKKDTPTGTAIIEVESGGNNRIVIIGGANDLVDKKYIDNNIESILENDIFLLQLEIPLDTTIYLAKLLKANNKTVIFDPAPACDLPKELFQYIDFLTPNETELEILTNSKITNENDLLVKSKELLNLGVKNIIAKSGKKGAYLINNDVFTLVEGFKVNTIDTVAAGDSFNAGFAHSLSCNNNVLDSIRFANAVAGLSTTGKGAQEAMPKLEAVNKLLNK